MLYCLRAEMRNSGNHCSFVLLAEFHIFEGAQLKYQFPQPLGIDEGCEGYHFLQDNDHDDVF